ncbi:MULTISPECIES: VRR-NUC domain-containing protein [Burkholderia cepacia complex]|uniref:VRR-NUC domain-containing protein n=1 Tax=Burkholderia cepacia complex TaxID=87882 RepID=UPI000CFFFB3A|nr:MULTISPECIES: VRR-NUC domain-containing protein [Burkholderia cepacia complex]MBR8300921.1 VRR-NUC domain-containing protein [Burkholderia dolosa]MBU9208063.1 VRR-NUC domain-containing protein [Burkholderia multivorans]MBU9651476.1 VRR-NUC domain-containing protein [Burkholderia multivorans]MCO1381259.1 VRR-NUC domain-containing protein [Burkholderia multivorans]MCO1401372.1 VRR-NUC domain-containing protein [Burkholderia multivorans]
MATTMETVATCQTVNEDRKTYAELPPGTKGYLQEKIEYALKAPDIVNIRLPDGSNTISTLKQIVMTAAIRVDESLADFRWQYKAEVSFDMYPDLVSNGRDAPIPFLSAATEDGPGRRHSLNPFPKGFVPGLLRRPDVIIVRNPADRWPGRSPRDHQGNPHADNSLRLVEVKFPGDAWGAGQERAYQKIAGAPGEHKYRMTVIDVSDCNGDLEKARQRALAMSPEERQAELRRRQRERQLRAPIRTVEPIPEPAWYEAWIRKVEEAGEATVAAVWDAVNAGAQYLSTEMEAWLQEYAPWALTAGKWVADKATATWRWVDETGREIFRYTTAQLKAGWDAIVRVTDMTWELLKQINWSQIGTSIIKGLVFVAAVVAGVVIVIVLAEALVAVLLALAAIVATATAETVAALAIALGVTTAAA